MLNSQDLADAEKTGEANRPTYKPSAPLLPENHY